MCASWAATVTPARYHGTLSGYTHHGCRCGDCTRARQNYDRVYKSGDLGLLRETLAERDGSVIAGGDDLLTSAADDGAAGSVSPSRSASATHKTGAGTTGVLGTPGRGRMGSRSPAPHSFNEEGGRNDFPEPARPPSKGV